jgi:hypothetical protein
MDWIWCVRCEKIYLVSTTWYCEKIPIRIRLPAMVHYRHCRDRFCTGVCAVLNWFDTHPKMSLRSNGLDWTCSLQKISIWIHLSDMVHYKRCRDRFCTGICEVMKWSETHPNMCFGSNGVDWMLPLRETLNRIRPHDLVHGFCWSRLDVLNAKNSDLDSTKR